MNDINPRGLQRPRDGSGRGVGMPGGRRLGKNTGPCRLPLPGETNGFLIPFENNGFGPGYGKGGGRGRGRGRTA